MKYNDNTPEYTRFLYLTEKDPYEILRAFCKLSRNEGERDKQIGERVKLRRRLKTFSLLLEKKKCIDPSVRGSRLRASQRVYDFEDVFGFFNAKNEK